MVDVVAELGGGVVDGGGADGLVFHGAEGGELRLELGFEQEEAAQVDSQPHDGHHCDGVDDLLAEDGVLGVLPAFGVGLAH